MMMLTTSVTRVVLVTACLSSILVQSKKLTKQSFKELAGSEFNLLVNFHSPRCPQCVALQPVWATLTKLVNEDPVASRSTIIASVDCTKENELCNKENVRGYPTLKIFRADDATGTEYDGPRDLSSLVELLQKQLGVEVVKPESAKESADAASSSKTKFVVQSLSWQDLVDMEKEDAAQDSAQEEPVLNREDDVHSEIPEPVSGLYELNEETYRRFLSRGRHFVNFFQSWCGHCQRLEPVWLKLADSLKHQKSVSISRVNCENNPSVCDAFQVKGYPTLLWIVDGEVVAKYDGSRSLPDLKKFITDKVSEDQEKGEEIRSEDHVVHLTEETFERVTRDGASFIMFSAPYCSHCKRLSPLIDDLSIKYAHSPTVRVAKIDCSQFDALCTSHGVDGYPSLILFKSGVKLAEYEGERTLLDIDSFIRSHLEQKDEL